MPTELVLLLLFVTAITVPAFLYEEFVLERDAEPRGQRKVPRQTTTPQREKDTSDGP